MNAEQVNAVGSWCELVGVAFLVRDLMSLARFREKPKEWSAQFRQWATRVRAWWMKTQVMAWWRRLLRRPPQVVRAKAGIATGSMIAGDATVSTGSATLTAEPGQSLKDHVEELRQRVNQLTEQIAREKREREQAIAAEQMARHEEVWAEAQERERRIAEVQRDVEKLRDVTTGDLGLKVESVLYLAAGIVLTAWPDLVAEWLPDWVEFRVVLAFVLGWPLLRFTWLRGPWWTRPRRSPSHPENRSEPAANAVVLAEVCIHARELIIAKK
jgi:hypothetical protein